MDDRQRYVEVIKQLSELYRKIDRILLNINRYELYIKRGIIVNNEVSFDGDLKLLKETLTYKKNKIRNEFIPIVQSYLYN